MPLQDECQLDSAGEGEQQAVDRRLQSLREKHTHKEGGTTL